MPAALTPGSVTITFRLGADELDITARTTAGDDQHWIDAGARARFERLVGGLVDVAEITSEKDGERAVHGPKKSTIG